MRVQNPPAEHNHMTPVNPEKGRSESRQQTQPILLLWGLVFNMDHCDGRCLVSESLMSRGQMGTGLLELLSSCVLVAYLNPRKQRA